MKILSTVGFILAALLTLNASAMVADSTYYTRLNNMAPLEGLGDALNKNQNVLVAVYDFAVQGGAVSTVKLLDDRGNPAILPNKAVVQRVLVEVITAVTSSSSCTVTLDSKGAADLMSSKQSTSLTLAAFLDGVPVDTAATALKMTADTRITATIGTTAATAGKIRAFIRYVISE